MAVQFLSAIDLNGNKAVEMGTCTVGTDGANKAYVDSTVAASAPLTFAQTIGNGSLTGFVLTHNFGGADYVFTVKDLTTGDFVYTDANGDDPDQLTLTFASAPATNSIRVAIIGFS